MSDSVVGAAPVGVVGASPSSTHAAAASTVVITSGSNSSVTSVAVPARPRQRPNVAKASAGAGVAMDDWNADLEDDPVDEEAAAEEQERAEYTAELIRDALRDMNRTDKTCQYERRIALREIKVVLQDAYDDTGEAPTNPKVREYLHRDENADTIEQFNLLHGEMKRVLAVADSTRSRIEQLCHVVRSAWRAQAYRPTADLFEIAVLRGGKRLRPSATTVAVLEAMADAYVRPHGMDGEDAAAVIGDARVQLRDLLIACGVPEARAAPMCRDPEDGWPLQAAIARVQAGLDEYKAAIELAHALRDPVPNGEARPEVTLVEQFIDQGTAALQRMKRWQELTATPFYVSRGAQLRFGVPVEDIGGTEPFSVVLERALKRAKAHLPAKRREWVDPYDAPAAKST